MSETIQLAFLQGTLRTGGAELQMIALTKGLVAQGFRVDFVIRGGPGLMDDAAREAGAAVRIIGEPSSGSVAARTRYRRRLTKHARWIATARQERYDIVDAWLNPNDVFAALARPLTRTPVIMAARLDLLPRTRFGPATRMVEASANRLTDVVVANAQVTADAAVQKHGVSPDKVRIIRGGVDVSRLHDGAERRVVRAGLGLGEDQLLIGCVGTFRRMKRQDLLVEAFARLVPAHPRVHLLLVGDGEMRPRVEQRVRDLGLERHVTLTGVVTDVAPLYSAFDLYVQASNSEALPNVLLEASAAALPIVATAAGGSGEVVHDGQTGLLVPIEDLDALTAAMGRAIEDADLRRRLGAAARQLVEREYGMERFIREYADLYRTKLASRKGQRGLDT